MKYTYVGLIFLFLHTYINTLVNGLTTITLSYSVVEILPFFYPPQILERVPILGAKLKSRVGTSREHVKIYSRLLILQATVRLITPSDCIKLLFLSEFLE